MKQIKKIIRITLFLTTFLIGNVQAQFSNYYNVYSQSNANINHKVSGNIYSHSTQTINTIDYGALALANAQSERNQLEQIKLQNEQQAYQDEKQKQISLEIISDPIKAYDYGSWQGFISTDKMIFNKKTIKQIQESTGLKSFGYYYMFPAYFFIQLHWTNWQNVSKDGVTTEIFLSTPFYNKNNIKVDFEDNFEKDTLVVVGKEFQQLDETGKLKKVFCHKKELNLATVFSGKGYNTTIIWEDKFENGITDNYCVFYNNKAVVGNGISISVKVRYHGDKDEVTFEQLEGRRYYLKGLIEKIISTARLQDIKLIK